MDLLSATDIFPSRVTAVLRYLLAQRGQVAKREQLIGAMSPSPLGERTRMVEENLKACIEMGVVEAVAGDDSYIALSEISRCAFPRNIYDANSARRLLTQPICRADESGSQAFCRIVAWFLANDPLLTDTEHDAVCNRLTRAGRSDCLSLRNKTRYEQTAYWSVYAGFAWSCARPDGKTVPIFDPTEHLALVLPAYCSGQDKNGIPVLQLCETLAREWPVYPNGHYWNDIRDSLGSETNRDGMLAPSLHLALRRLQRRGWIKLVTLSDAPAVSVPGGSITHVLWCSKKGAKQPL